MYSTEQVYWTINQSDEYLDLYLFLVQDTLTLTDFCLRLADWLGADKVSLL